MAQLANLGGRVSPNGHGKVLAADNGKSKSKDVISVPTLDEREFAVQLIGTTPLIVHAFSAESHKSIADKQEKKARTAKKARDPHDEYLNCFYLMPDSGPAGSATAKYGIPAAGIKKACISACRYVDGMAMSFVTGAFFVIADGGGNIAIDASKPFMRTDTVRIGRPPNKTLMLRYRPEFSEWKCRVRLRYNAAVITPEQIVNLLHHAGFHVGYGEMRPEKGGLSYGMFRVATDEQASVKKGKGRRS